MLIRNFRFTLPQGSIFPFESQSSTESNLTDYLVNQDVIIHELSRRQCSKDLETREQSPSWPAQSLNPIRLTSLFLLVACLFLWTTRVGYDGSPW
jgi:hypothetical protein